MTVREQLSDATFKFTRSELKVIKELLRQYPVSGLSTVSNLARRSGVSDPTVMRLVLKLGYSGFPDFQAALLEEVDAHLRSPFTMASQARPSKGAKNPLEQYFSTLSSALNPALIEVLPVRFPAIVEMLSDNRSRVLCLGGRFSRYLASLLRWHLQQVRPNTEYLETAGTDLTDRLVDISKRDVLVVYDFRRYQADVIRFSTEAANAGAAVVLVTDRWKSPIFKVAKATIAVPVESGSPFDSMVSALAVTEALINAVTSTLGKQFKRRIERIEAYRSANYLDVGEEER